MKGDREDLKKLAEDIHGAMLNHPDATQHNPDIQTDLVKLRDKCMRRYEGLGESPVAPKHEGYVH